MSTSLLYHAFGIRGYQYVSTQYHNGEVIFQIRQRKTDLFCPRCGALQIIRKGTVKRAFSCVPIGSKPVCVVLPVQRVLCLVWQGDYAQAEKFYQRALFIWDRVFGTESHHVAITLKNMAKLYRATHREKEALILEERASRIRSKIKFRPFAD